MFAVQRSRSADHDGIEASFPESLLGRKSVPSPEAFLQIKRPLPIEVIQRIQLQVWTLSDRWQMPQLRDHAATQHTDFELSHSLLYLTLKVLNPVNRQL